MIKSLKEAGFKVLANNLRKIAPSEFAEIIGYSEGYSSKFHKFFRIEEPYSIEPEICEEIYYGLQDDIVIEIVQEHL